MSSIAKVRSPVEGEGAESVGGTGCAERKARDGPVVPRPVQPRRPASFAYTTRPNPRAAESAAASYPPDPDSPSLVRIAPIERLVRIPPIERLAAARSSPTLGACPRNLLLRPTILSLRRACSASRLLNGSRTRLRA